ncbi:MAG: M23 family metallopeptidase [Solirubrobacterales bacterium]|nr:M23 family metallopeptidase [Solirubrobacterales bacterium]
MTPVVASVLAAPEPVPATDGRKHLVYELILTNRGAPSVTVKRIQVLSAGRVIGSLAGARLSSVMLPFGATKPGATLRGGQAGYVLMDVTVARRARAPGRLVHRLTIAQTPRDPGAAMSYLAAPTRVDNRPALVVAPPLRGAGWVDTSSCCDSLTAHRGAVLPVNGALRVAERFAIDFVQVNPQGLLFSGPKTALSSYPFFGADVLSATSGTVVGVVDNLPETTPGALPKGITAAQAGGDHVVVAVGGGRYAFYAHLQPGSIVVAPGQRVRVGQKLGLLGNSGNSDAPHLHFHIMDGPSPLNSNGLPFRFSRFNLEGELTNFGAFSAGRPARIVPRLRGIHTGELPLNNQVLDFGR